MIISKRATQSKRTILKNSLKMELISITEIRLPKTKEMLLSLLSQRVNQEMLKKMSKPSIAMKSLQISAPRSSRDPVNLQTLTTWSKGRKRKILKQS